MQTTHIWLIRHGETPWNAARKLQGWQDIPLNEKGTAQAENLAKYLASSQLRFDHVISSDLRRASDTAKIALPECVPSLLLEPGLRERGFGVMEGKSWDSFGDAGPDQPTRNAHALDVAVEGGESVRQFQSRVLGSFERLAATHPGKKLAVFAHGGVIDMVWRKLHQLDLLVVRDEPIVNTSINYFTLAQQPNGYAWSPVKWGQTDHIIEHALDNIG